jgi:hypothetical protein
MRTELRHGRLSFTLRALALATIVVAATLAPGGASASELIARDANDIKLEVSREGKALVTYRERGKLKHLLAWGAINALAPTRSRPQVQFEHDYSGGWGRFHRDVWKTLRNTCRAYDGPELHWQVAACKASDGSYWALQAWQRQLPNVGLAPTPFQGAWELRLSHWRGPLAVLAIKLDWAYRQWHHLYGTYTYLGKPVYGFRSTSQGYVLDKYGRNIFVDTYNSAYGKGWKRENSFLTHNPNGNFCYGFFPGQNNSRRPAGRGEAYRATVIGPGVTPDVFWQGEAPGDYDRQLDLVANDEQRDLNAGRPLCKPN